jgi:hypothetical protein
VVSARTARRSAAAASSAWAVARASATPARPSAEVAASCAAAAGCWASLMASRASGAGSLDLAAGLALGGQGLFPGGVGCQPGGVLLGAGGLGAGGLLPGGGRVTGGGVPLGLGDGPGGLGLAARGLGGGAGRVGGRGSGLGVGQLDARLLGVGPGGLDVGERGVALGPGSFLGPVGVGEGLSGGGLGGVPQPLGGRGAGLRLGDVAAGISGHGDLLRLQGLRVGGLGECTGGHGDLLGDPSEQLSQPVDRQCQRRRRHRRRPLPRPDAGGLASGRGPGLLAGEHAADSGLAAVDQLGDLAQRPAGGVGGDDEGLQAGLGVACRGSAGAGGASELRQWAQLRPRRVGHAGTVGPAPTTCSGRYQSGRGSECHPCAPPRLGRRRRTADGRRRSARPASAPTAGS